VGRRSNPAHHGFNLGEPGQKLTRIEICKKISTQPEPVVSRVGSRVPTHFDSSKIYELKPTFEF